MTKLTEGDQPSDNDRVRVEVVWKGQKYDYTTEVASEQATHYVMDRQVYKAHIEVRRTLARIEYPDAFLVHKNGPVRDESALWNGIAAYLSQHLDARFEFAPPEPNRGIRTWRAYFKTTQDELFAVETNPPVGLGTRYAVAIENLLRFIEGTEPIDG